jgi:hypothetical protein
VGGTPDASAKIGSAHGSNFHPLVWIPDVGVFRDQLNSIDQEHDTREEALEAATTSLGTTRCES